VKYTFKFLITESWGGGGDVVKYSGSCYTGLVCNLCYVQGLQITDDHKPLLEATGKELLEEKAEALEVCEH
jgi:hypothetical protein